MGGQWEKAVNYRLSACVGGGWKIIGEAERDGREGTYTPHHMHTHKHCLKVVRSTKRLHNSSYLSPPPLTQSLYRYL